MMDSISVPPGKTTPSRKELSASPPKGPLPNRQSDTALRQKTWEEKRYRAFLAGSILVLVSVLLLGLLVVL